MTNAVTLAKQMGATLLPDNDQWTNRFKIKSESSSRLYTIAQNKHNGRFACSCPGWISHKHCKHLDRLQPYLDQVERVR